MCPSSQRKTTRDLEGTRKEKWELLVNVLGQCDRTMHYLCIVLEKEKYSLTEVLFSFLFVFEHPCNT